MPELNDNMYSSQQISIPPMFPYVLRQFGKSAIRSQPVDLLRWATAYFRCLALDLPPPVKPRLEYPLPRDYHGITPGWLRALMYQFQGSLTVPFKVLWDRWTGSCLRHQTLIAILCLGAFTEPTAVPLYRLLGLCAGFLTDNLTQTMILFCEIITEEPEGCSAIVPVEIWNDVYAFLAAIDASAPQILYNLYFTDFALGLVEEKPKPKEVIPEEEEEFISELLPEEEETAPETEEEPSIIDDGVVSCPDIAADKEMDYPVVGPEDDVIAIGVADDLNLEIQFDTLEIDDDLPLIDAEPAGVEEEGFGEGEEEVKYNVGEEEMEEEGDEMEDQGEEKEGEGIEGGSKSEDGKVGEEKEEKYKDFEEEHVCEEEEEMGVWESQTTIQDKPMGDSTEPIAAETVVYIDLGRVSSQDGDGEMEEYFGEEKSLSISDQIKVESAIDVDVDRKSDDFDIEEFFAVDETKPEEIYLEAIPGIGGVVPLEMVNAVAKYMLGVSAEQHGVVMPRNIRHYTCPPLEIISTL